MPSTASRPILTASGRPYRRPASETTSGREGPRTGAFDALPVTPANHFVLHFHAALFRVVHYARHLAQRAGDPPDAVLDTHPFLKLYLAESRRFMPDGLAWSDGAGWWDDQIQQWEQSDRSVFLPLRALETELGLTMAERMAFVSIGLLEEDARLGTLFAETQAPLSSRRPTLELIARIVRRPDDPLDAWPITRTLLQHGLVAVSDQSAPRSEWVLRVPTLVWEAARGDEPRGGGFTLHATEAFPAIEDLVGPASFTDHVARVPRLLTRGRIRTLVVRGTPGSERRTVLGAIGRAAGRRLLAVPAHPTADRSGPSALTVDVKALGPLCTLTGAMPALQVELGPGETVRLPRIPGYAGPRCVLMGTVGGLEAGPEEGLDEALTLVMPRLCADDRRAHWTAAFDGMAVDDLDAITRRFMLPGRYIRQAGAQARSRAALDGRSHVTPQDVRQACRSLGRQLLDTLAEPLQPTGSWSGLVVGDAPWRSLRELERRCRHREALLHHLGPAFDGNATAGVRALFSGPSGTGKTLAAKILAAELEMDLYRVDLAAVINKYVGETEKNLHRVLSTAEELDVILLLDEGDALLGTRTDVRSANDRHANLETNYLLQRLEHYRGIVVVTTNLSENVDRAFQRRMDLTVEFQLPRALERLRIWQLHLPAHHAVPAASLEAIAARCMLTGGQIRNAAQRAALHALDAGRPAVGEADLRAAVRAEYQKMGAGCPLGPGPDAGTPRRAERGSVHTFLQGLR
jgi:hypothetical protein